MKQAQIFNEPTEVKFNNFNNENPRVYELYKKYALALIQRGHKRIGSKMIIERIRYETKLLTTDKDYKINNNYTAHYARLFTRDFPQHVDKFCFKNLTAY
jgi:hypothetical protein